MKKVYCLIDLELEAALLAQTLVKLFKIANGSRKVRLKAVALKSVARRQRRTDKVEIMLTS